MESNLKSQKQMWYHTFELAFGFILYTPNFQAAYRDTLSLCQYVILISGGLLCIHAITNLFILTYNLLTDFGCKLATPIKKKPKDLDISLVSPELPQITRPLIDQKSTSKVNTPIKQAPQKDSGTKMSNSLLLDSTLDLLKWGSPKSATSHSPGLSNSYIMSDTQIDDLINSPNSSLYLAKNASSSSLAEEKDDLGLSFYSNKSFLNSYDEKSPHKNQSLLNSWTGKSLSNSFTEESKRQLKERLSQQIYRVSTPPSSPRTKESVFEKKNESGDQKTEILKFSPYQFGWSKYKNIDKLKLWLNTHIISSLSNELKKMDKTFKSKGIKTLDKFSYEHLYSLIHDDSIVDTDELSTVEIAHHRHLLEGYRAQIYRILPYLENLANKNEKWDSVISRIHQLASCGYLSCFDATKDTQLIVNCILEHFNSKPLALANNSFGLKPKSWFSHRYFCDYSNHNSKEAWLVRNPEKKQGLVNDDGKIRVLLSQMFQQKQAIDNNCRTSRIDVLESNKHTTSGLINQLAPFLVKYKNTFILVKDAQTLHEFTSSSAVYEAWLALFDCLKNDSSIGPFIPI